METKEEFIQRMNTLKIPEGFTAIMKTEPVWGSIVGWCELPTPQMGE